MAFVTHTSDTVVIGCDLYKTRTWYMRQVPDSTAEDRLARHFEYYSQFVTKAVRNVVANNFKDWDRLQEAYVAGDVHFNKVTELRQWDSLDDTLRRLCGSTVTKCSYSEYTKGSVMWSLSESICIAKTAARLIILDRLKANES